MRLRTELVALALSPLGLSGITSPAAGPHEPEGGPLAVRFLGDNGLHRPRDRYADRSDPRRARDRCGRSRAGLGPQSRGGRELRHPPEPREQDGITKAQDQAVLDDVANGGGFVPLRCAWDCFLNFSESIALLGAWFQRQGTGGFEAAVADPDLPISKGAKMQIRLLWLACGNQDNLLRLGQGMHACLTE
jgi:hypothetical protein